jgi:hypothetical protein
MAAAAVGTLTALHYHRLGLTLSHYDARGHLVVARRIFDSITPGWLQIGAVWLPLPHLLNALPVQVDAWYRSGGSAVVISIASFALTAAAVCLIVQMATESKVASVAAVALVILDPNLLYLQSTPMTEPLLLGLMTLGVAWLFDWTRGSRRSAASIGLVLALACLTRYEAWTVTAMALALSTLALWRQGEPPLSAVTRVSAIACYPFAAIVGFICFSRVVVGEWFVSSGFFVPDNPAIGHPLTAFSEIVWGVETLGGRLLFFVAIAGLFWALWRALTIRDRAAEMVLPALAATAALPWVAFLEGHPYRIRYMVPLIIAEAVGAGIVIAAVAERRKSLAAVVASLLVGLVLVQRPPLSGNAAMVLEAQWDRPNMAARQQVTDYIQSRYRGDTIMASMGSLGHYMQEMSAAGFDIRDFLHEGNGDIWLRALEGPEPFVGWILIEEKAEGGDMLSKVARENPFFLRGFSRVMESAGLAVYERQNRMLNVAR